MEKFSSNDIKNQNLFYFLFSFSPKTLFYILNHPLFYYSEKKLLNFSIFFENFRKIKKYTKLCLKIIILINNDNKEIKNEN